jgi:putative flippase GtrA
MRRLVERHRQVLLFLFGGGASAAIDVGLMQLLRLAAGSDYMAATTAGFVAGLLFNYTFHARYTFRSKMTQASIVRYLCVVALNYGITLVCVSATVAWNGEPLPGKLLSLFIVPLNGYFLGKHWTFKEAA